MAGINAWEPLAQATTATWDRVMGTNVHAPYLLCRESGAPYGGAGIWPHRKHRFRPCRRRRENVQPMWASKHGLAGMTRAMAAELGPKGVTVNMMAPGYFLTEINTTILARPGSRRGVSSRIPLGRWGDPEGPRCRCVSGVKRLPSYVNGHVLVVDGGLTETFVLPVDAA